MAGKTIKQVYEGRRGGGDDSDGGEGGGGLGPLIILFAIVAISFFIFNVMRTAGYR